MRRTRIEKEIKMCATNLTNKTMCVSPNAKGGGDLRRQVVSTTSAICGVKPNGKR
jgi:hypothetical protein